MKRDSKEYQLVTNLVTALDSTAIRKRIQEEPGFQKFLKDNDGNIKIAQYVHRMNQVGSSPEIRGIPTHIKSIQDLAKAMEGNIAKVVTEEIKDKLFLKK